MKGLVFTFLLLVSLISFGIYSGTLAEEFIRNKKEIRNG